MHPTRIVGNIKTLGCILYTRKVFYRTALLEKLNVLDFIEIFISRFISEFIVQSNTRYII